MLILEFALPKDRLLLLLGDYAQTYGAGIYDPNMLNVFLGLADGNIDDVCPQSKLADYSGVDSLVAPAVCGLTLILFQLLPCVPTESKSWWFTKASGATHRVAGRRATQHTRTQQTGCTPILAPFRWSLSNLSKGEARPRRPRPAAASRPKPPDDETARRETTALGLLSAHPTARGSRGEATWGHIHVA